MAPLVSVCLPTYNGARFLAEQVQSVLDQSLTDLEVIVSDDGSTDGTPAILADFAARDPRIRILPPGPRLGMQKNYERVIAAAACRSIAPCDQDDVWLPDKLAALLERLQQTGAALVYCDSLFIDEDGRSLDTTLFAQRFRIEGRDPLMFAFHNSAAGHASLFDRAILSHALPFPDAPFYDWWIAAVAASFGGIASLDRPLVHYRQHTASVTADLRRAQAQSRSRKVFEGIAEDTKRLAAFARLPGMREKFTAASANWPLRGTRYLIPELTLFLLRHPSLHAPRATPGFRDWWRCVMRGIGLPLRHPLLARDHAKGDRSRGQT